jgi:hypothetical protein
MVKARSLCRGAHKVAGETLLNAIQTELSLEADKITESLLSLRIWLVRRSRPCRGRLGHCRLERGVFRLVSCCAGWPGGNKKTPRGGGSTYCLPR